MPELPAPGATATVGDLALTFGEHRPTRSRGGPWTVLTEAPGWRLWATDPSPTWRGHRLHRTEDPTDLLLTIGHRPEHWLSLRHSTEDSTWRVRTDRFATLHAYAGPGIVTTFSPAAWDDDPTARLAGRSPASCASAGTPPTGCRSSACACCGRPPRTAGTPTAGPPPAPPVAGLGPRPRAGPRGRRTRPTRSPPCSTSPRPAGRTGPARPADLRWPRLPGHRRRRSPGPGRPPDRDLWAYSYGYDAASPELRIAGEVAEARGLPLHATVIPPYLFDRVDEVVDATEGLVDLTLCRQSVDRPGAAGRDADAVVAAHWGDVWFGAPHAGSRRRTGRRRCWPPATKRGHEWLTEHLVRPHLGHDPEAELRDLLAAEADRLGSVDDPDVRLLALKTEQWSLRWTQATLRAFQAATEPRLPFYDPRIADFALGLPSDLLDDRRSADRAPAPPRPGPGPGRVAGRRDRPLLAAPRTAPGGLPRRAARRVARAGCARRRPGCRNWEVQLLGSRGPGRRRPVARSSPAPRIHDLVDRHGGAATWSSRHRTPPDRPGLGYAVVRPADARSVEGAVHVIVGVVGLARRARALPRPAPRRARRRQGIDVRLGPDGPTCSTSRGRRPRSSTPTCSTAGRPSS